MPGESSKRVLVVDDDFAVREMISSAFRQRGVAVDTASDGVEALQRIHEQQYAVILLDLLMPVADGFSVLEALSAAPSSTMPIVLVVTGADRQAIESLDARIIHGILKKPFDVHDLVSLVVACVEIRDRSTFETMAIAAMLAAPPFVAWLTRFGN